MRTPARVSNVRVLSIVDIAAFAPSSSPAFNCAIGAARVGTIHRSAYARPRHFSIRTHPFPDRCQGMDVKLWPPAAQNGPLGDEMDPIAVEADDIALRIGQKNDFMHAEFEENLCPDAILPQFGDRLLHGVALAFPH